MTINRRHAAMPLSFEAFRTLHHADYLAYARACLPSHRADEAVEQTFLALSGGWRAVLGSSSPTNTAWTLLNGHVHANDGEPCCSTGALREELGTLAALGYSPDRIAALTGLPLGRIRSVARTRAFVPLGGPVNK
ncbi:MULTISPECIES: hypothetical protein [Streptomyces]|uniref:Uncharacterized protein n=1 Tax=Streptomyces venezuelae TaxID=54571 RepID=A0A5P2B140_STRVZ|nr:hypothetical protein [Streptomyces venezuelae]QES24155.1 hypothetical protein DEJ46_37810 [Streptomyces venezuelae]